MIGVLPASGGGSAVRILPAQGARSDLGVRLLPSNPMVVLPFLGPAMERTESTTPASQVQLDVAPWQPSLHREFEVVQRPRQRGGTHVGGQPRIGRDDRVAEDARPVEVTLRNVGGRVGAGVSEQHDGKNDLAPRRASSHSRRPGSHDGPTGPRPLRRVDPAPV